MSLDNIEHMRPFFQAYPDLLAKGHAARGLLDSSKIRHAPRDESSTAEPRLLGQCIADPLTGNSTARPGRRTGKAIPRRAKPGKRKAGDGAS